MGTHHADDEIGAAERAKACTTTAQCPRRAGPDRLQDRTNDAQRAASREQESWAP
jgi:hypothetical protein